MNPLQEYLKEYDSPPKTEREVKLAAAIEKKAAMVKESFTGLGKAIQMGVKGGGGVIGQGLIQTGKETAKQTAKATARTLSKRVRPSPAWGGGAKPKVKVPSRPTAKPKPTAKPPPAESVPGQQVATKQQASVSKAVNPQAAPPPQMPQTFPTSPAARYGPLNAPTPAGPAVGPAGAKQVATPVYQNTPEVANIVKQNPELQKLMVSGGATSPTQILEQAGGLGAGQQHALLQQHVGNLTKQLNSTANPAAKTAINNALKESQSMMTQLTQTGKPIQKGLMGGYGAFGGATPTSDIVKKLRWPAAGVGAVYLGSQAMGGGQQYTPQGY